jgi:hypothetical protein
MAIENCEEFVVLNFPQTMRDMSLSEKSEMCE